MTARSRRLVAILALDVQAYSRHMAASELKTLEEVRRIRRECVEPALAAHGGRLTKTMGDGFLAEFDSAVNAMQCAVEIQLAMARDSGPLKLRAGVNVGDVVVEDGDIFGDAVNVAARLESLAPIGGIAFSGAVKDQLLGRFDQPFVDSGDQMLKNIERPVHVWHWLPHPGPVEQSQEDNTGHRTTEVPSESTPAPNPSTDLALPDKPSLVVLPFDSLSKDPDDEFLADGMVESITATLSRIKFFFVIARNSAFAYKGKRKGMRDVGRELGVAYALEGSIQRVGSRLRITIQLIDTQNDVHLWAERYDGTMDDIFDLQDRITERVAGALLPSIQKAEVERARRKRPAEMCAYDYTMRAMQHVWTLEQAEIQSAVDLLRKARESDPSYPLAMALEAWCWAQRGVYGWYANAAEARSKAAELAAQAADKASDDPMVLAILGAVQCLARQYGEAEVVLKRALMLDPNSAWATSRLAWLYVYTDKHLEARPVYERAMRLSPLDPMNFNAMVGLACTYQFLDEHDTAADLFSRALRERPNAVWIHRNLAPALLAAGQVQEARNSVAILLKHHPDFTQKKYRETMALSRPYIDKMCALLGQLGIPEDAPIQG